MIVLFLFTQYAVSVSDIGTLGHKILVAAHQNIFVVEVSFFHFRKKIENNKNINKVFGKLKSNATTFPTVQNLFGYYPDRL